jgi:hypothetical protein
VRELLLLARNDVFDPDVSVGRALDPRRCMALAASALAGSIV